MCQSKTNCATSTDIFEMAASGGEAVVADSPPLSPDTLAWNALCDVADAMQDRDDAEVVLHVDSNAAIERNAKIYELRKKWGGKGKGGILGDLHARHQGKGSGGYKYCKGTCKCRAGALKDGCLKKKGETILNQTNH